MIYDKFDEVDSMNVFLVKIDPTKLMNEVYEQFIYLADNQPI